MCAAPSKAAPAPTAQSHVPAGMSVHMCPVEAPLPSGGREEQGQSSQPVSSGRFQQCTVGSCCPAPSR